MASLIIAAVVSLAWSAAAIWIGPRIGYVDRPDDPTLKAHQHDAVPLGGVGVFLGVHLAAVARGGIDPNLLLATGIVLVLGLVDDRRGLTPVVRLGVELIAAAVLVLGGYRADGFLFIVFGLALVVLSINAVNLFDGLDGLAGSVSLVTALGLALLAAGRGLGSDVPLETAAALAGFLVIGWHPARVFLGDAGAYVVGMLLAHSILSATDGAVLPLMIAAGLLGVLIVDLLITVLRRRLSGHPLFLGDRSHIYDQLRDRGMPIPVIALLMSGAQAVVALSVLGVDRSMASWSGLVVLAVILLGTVLLLSRLGFLRPASR